MDTALSDLEVKVNNSQSVLARLEAEVDSLKTSNTNVSPDVLSELKVIRQNLIQVNEESKTAAARLKQLEAENAALKTQVAKKDYRIMHLIRSLDEAEKKQ
eukprot:c10586_g1_i1.p1 GENE.c10586_g1_i1~~c10586_g1_i1.p1  ORF type:complete len:101 (-),score=37.00 c10586_g1_i1:193-495(-)